MSRHRIDTIWHVLKSRSGSQLLTASQRLAKICKQRQIIRHGQFSMKPLGRVKAQHSFYVNPLFQLP